jgi:hypothetical protein
VNEEEEGRKDATGELKEETWPSPKDGGVSKSEGGNRIGRLILTALLFVAVVALVIAMAWDPIRSRLVPWPDGSRGSEVSSAKVKNGLGPRAKPTNLPVGQSTEKPKGGGTPSSRPNDSTRQSEKPREDGPHEPKVLAGGELSKANGPASRLQPNAKFVIGDYEIGFFRVSCG